MALRVLRASFTVPEHQTSPNSWASLRTRFVQVWIGETAATAMIDRCLQNGAMRRTICVRTLPAISMVCGASAGRISAARTAQSRAQRMILAVFAVTMGPVTSMVFASATICWREATVSLVFSTKHTSCGRLPRKEQPALEERHLNVAALRSLRGDLHK
jgi:hypothetical protein